jgi:hypothetical protein
MAEHPVIESTTESPTGPAERPAAAEQPEPAESVGSDESVGSAEDPETPVAPASLRLRRAPRYRPFGLTGALIGVIAGVILALSFTATSDYTMQTIAGYFAAILGLIGTVLGLGLAVLLDRRRS